MGAQIFGHVSTGATNSDVHQNEVAEDGNISTQGDSPPLERSLVTALASVTITESPWGSAPSYPGLYLSTVEEYLPPQTKPKLPKGVQVSELGDNETKVDWATETYENSLAMDHVFERFIKRISHEGDQCVRSATNLLYV